MNRYLFFFIIVLFIGCDKTEDNIFTQTPDERLKATADEYREALFSAPNGWFLAVDTKKDGASKAFKRHEEIQGTTEVSPALLKVASISESIPTRSFSSNDIHSR